VDEATQEEEEEEQEIRREKRRRTNRHAHRSKDLYAHVSRISAQRVVAVHHSTHTGDVDSTTHSHSLRSATLHLGAQGMW
jgi:hypothetical protein